MIRLIQRNNKPIYIKSSSIYLHTSSKISQKPDLSDLIKKYEKDDSEKYPGSTKTELTPEQNLKIEELINKKIDMDSIMKQYNKTGKLDLINFDKETNAEFRKVLGWDENSNLKLSMQPEIGFFDEKPKPPEDIGRKIFGPEDHEHNIFYDEELRRNNQGTFDSPLMVTSKFDTAIVGCVCDADRDLNVKWFYLEDGPVQKCQCGYHYKLLMTEAPDDYGMIMGYDKVTNIKQASIDAEIKAVALRQHALAQEAKKEPKQVTDLASMGKDDPRRVILEDEIYGTATKETSMFSKFLSKFKR